MTLECEEQSSVREELELKFPNDIEMNEEKRKLPFKLGMKPFQTEFDPTQRQVLWFFPTSASQLKFVQLTVPA